MRKRNMPNLLALFIACVTLFWGLGLVLVCLNCGEILHIPRWLVGMFFWLPYALVIVVTVILLMHAVLSKNKRD